MLRCSFRISRFLKLGQNKIQNHLCIEDNQATRASSIIGVGKIPGYLTWRCSPKYYFTSSTLTTEKQYTLKQFLSEHIAESQIYGVHYTEKDSCVLLKILSDIIEELQANHVNSVYHGAISSESILVSYSNGRWRGSLSNLVKVDHASESSDMCDLGRTIDFVYNEIENLPYHPKRHATVELKDLKDSLKNQTANLSETRHHPAFWDFRKKMLFLRDFTERTDLNCFKLQNMLKYNYLERIDMTARVLHQTHATVLNQPHWSLKIDYALVIAMSRKRGYGNDLMDLLIWLRNLNAHYRDKVNQLQAVLPCGTHEELGEYILSRFPNLLIEVYNYAKKNHSNDKWFESYVFH